MLRTDRFSGAILRLESGENCHVECFEGGSTLLSTITVDGKTVPTYSIRCKITSQSKLESSAAGMLAIHYNIEVETSLDVFWLLQRKYSEFKQLYLELKDRDVMERVVFPEEDESIIAQLNDFCQALLSLEPLPASVQNFLRLDQH